MRTVHSLIARRSIPHVRIGRKVMFKLQDVDEHLRRNALGPML